MAFPSKFLSGERDKPDWRTSEFSDAVGWRMKKDF
jgi:hypothetical protein